MKQPCDNTFLSFRSVSKGLESSFMSLDLFWWSYEKTNVPIVVIMSLSSTVLYVNQICHGFIADPRCSSAPTAVLKTQSRIVLQYLWQHCFTETELYGKKSFNPNSYFIFKICFLSSLFIGWWPVVLNVIWKMELVCLQQHCKYRSRTGFTFTHLKVPMGLFSISKLFNIWHVLYIDPLVILDWDFKYLLLLHALSTFHVVELNDDLILVWLYTICVKNIIFWQSKPCLRPQHQHDLPWNEEKQQPAQSVSLLTLNDGFSGWM